MSVHIRKRSRHIRIKWFEIESACFLCEWRTKNYLKIEEKQTANLKIAHAENRWLENHIASTVNDAINGKTERENANIECEKS